MTVVRTAKGRLLDMGALVSANGHVRAIGNASLNARGDKLNSRGEVVKTAEQIDAERLAYNRENPNAVATRLTSISALDTEVFASPAEAMKAAKNGEDTSAPAKTSKKKVVSTEE